MKIYNPQNTTVEIADLKVKGPDGYLTIAIVPAKGYFLLFDEDAEKSVVLATALANGALKKVGTQEPSDGGLVADIDPYVVIAPIPGELAVLQNDIAAVATTKADKFEILDLQNDLSALSVSTSADMAVMETNKANKSSQISTVDAVDLATAIALVNELKSKVNLMNS